MRFAPLALLLSLLAEPALAQAEAERVDLAAALRAFVHAPSLDGARAGIHVVDATTGEVACTHDGNRGFMPASNMKLVTTAAALRTLGPEFRFETRVLGTRAVDDGVLDGDLVLVGSGDPSFGGRRGGADPAAAMDAIAAALVDEHGLRRVTGRVLGDDDCHPDEIMGEGWSWGYQDASYAAQVSGLCFGENYLVLAFGTDTSEPGGGEPSAPSLRLLPPTNYVRVIHGAELGDGPTSLWATRRRATNVIVTGGRLQLGAGSTTRRVSVENPTAFAAHALREALERRGITVGGPALDTDELTPRLERYGDEVVLHTVTSHPLAKLVTTLNKISQNLYAEQLVRAAARHATGRGGMRDAAANAKRVLTELGVPAVERMRIADGSGLTRLNLVQPRQLVALVAGLDADPTLRATFRASLPVAGVDGTLTRRFARGPATGHVAAKTGYISSVAALSGIVYRAGTEPSEPAFYFSVVINNFTTPTSRARAPMDAFVHELARAAGWR